MYQQKYLKYKNKYINKKRFLQSGGDDIKKYNDDILEKWYEQYYNLYNYVMYLFENKPSELKYIVKPTSVRGQDLVEIFEFFYKKYPSDFESDYSIRYLYRAWHDIDDDRLDLLILSLQCMLFVEKTDDENNYLDPGDGSDDPYVNNNINQNVPIVNKILAKYPYTKALCPFGRECPYWNSDKSFYRFKQPYSYFVTGNSTGMNNSSIILAADIIQNNKNKDMYNKVVAHYNLWGHLPPTALDIIEDGLKTTEITSAEEIYQFDSIKDSDDFWDRGQWNKETGRNEYWDNLPIKRKELKCSTQLERELWGKTVGDRRWRANYPYITELCLYRSGMYYWD